MANSKIIDFDLCITGACDSELAQMEEHLQREKQRRIDEQKETNLRNLFDAIATFQKVGVSPYDEIEIPLLCDSCFEAMTIVKPISDLLDEITAYYKNKKK